MRGLVRQVSVDMPLVSRDHGWIRWGSPRGAYFTS